MERRMSFIARKHRLMIASSCVVLGLTAVTACGGSQGGAAASSESGITEIKLGTMPVIDVAPVRLGIEKGFFSKRDLKITMQDAQGGAVIVPAVVSGGYQFGYSNIVSLLVARAEKLPVKMVSVGARASDDVSEDGSGQLLTSDPEVKKAGDLKGKKVAVNTLKGLSEVAVRTGLEKYGVKAGDVELVEVPIPNMQTAIEKGQVSAALIGEPFTTTAKADGARALPVSYASLGKLSPFAGWFTSEQYAAANPEVVSRFKAALQESLTYAEDHPDEARAVLKTYLKLKPGVSEKVTLPGWDPATDAAEMKPLAQYTVDAGLIKNTDALDSLLAK
ncbi:ABC transporter substrate-binding protein [Streptomyces sp. NPDC057509]|uniref:ABC transporter substrate-binding protein n=1 Tax=Streptomyces sp. NPDC057509 TaxID=3346152 RepID=UPI003673C193